MNLFQALEQLPASQDISDSIPDYLYGAFRRKSISFSNGLTDEKTIVYWFQSRTFTIDIRLKSRENTPVNERQGWIGNTVWDDKEQLLSWEVDAESNYQNHVQWPELAELHAVGNSILEFSPSNVYVEDWRQQAYQGLFLGLRLNSAVNLASNEPLEMDGGLIICGDHIALTLTRSAADQQIVSALDLKTASADDEQAIQSFEVSIGLDGVHKFYTTSSAEMDQSFNFEDFEIVNSESLAQTLSLHGRNVRLIFDIDIYVPDYSFQRTTITTPSSEQWLIDEGSHLMHHAKLSL